MFLVPKYRVNDDGTIGEPNDVQCVGLEEKLGLHGSPTAVMAFGEAGECYGSLLGEENKGLRNMFIMMNSARLDVGMQGVGVAERSFQHALAYAQDRRQGRKPGVKTGKQVPIYEHPDVRRMLMNARAFNEGARALALWGAMLVDLSESAASEAGRTEAADLIGLLTPVIKAFFTDKGFENASNAQQCFGGHGYIREWGMEQFVRDARIAMIYEGTNGIQALDLVGRKLPANGGRALRSFIALVKTTLAPQQADETLAPMMKKLESAVGDLEAATAWLMRHALTNPEEAGAASVPYLQLLALVTFGHMWGRIAAAANAALPTAGERASFYQQKLTTAAYFFSHQLCETVTHRARVEAGSGNLMALAAEAF